MDALEFDRVSKSFSEKEPIVDQISFQVKQGEFFSLLGPSGCGKTTCLRMISGLETPNTGRILLNGKEVNRVHPHKRNVHMVFQRYALFPHLNVFDNVAFGLRMKKIPEKNISYSVQRMLELVNMGAYQTRRIQSLSGGEQQRIALVRALVNEPSILLLDEPLGALDHNLRVQMQQELVKIQKTLGITFIFVTHDQSEALALSDRILIMNKGRIEQIGSPSEIYNRPTTLFVARFVGAINLFPNGSSSLCVRPENIILKSERPTSGEWIEGKVVEKTYFGSSMLIKIETRHAPVPFILANTRHDRIDEKLVELGLTCFASWNKESAILIPEQTQ